MSNNKSRNYGQINETLQHLLSSLTALMFRTVKCLDTFNFDHITRKKVMLRFHFIWKLIILKKLKITDTMHINSLFRQANNISGPPF